MLSQIAGVAAEAAVVCEMLLGAVLLLLWVAIEAIGYCGLLFSIVRRQRWLVVVTPATPARQIKWGISVRAAGLRSRRPQAA